MKEFERDNKGRFSSQNPKRIVMRVTEEEKLLIEKFREIQSLPESQLNNFESELNKLIKNRTKNLEL